MKHLEGSWGIGFRPNGTVRKDVGQRYEEEPSYVLDCKLQIGAVSSLSFLFLYFSGRGWQVLHVLSIFAFAEFTIYFMRHIVNY